MSGALFEQLRQRGERAARLAVARAGEALVAAAEAELPGVAVGRDGADVVLRGAARRRLDGRVSGLVGGLAARAGDYP